MERLDDRLEESLSHNRKEMFAKLAADAGMLAFSLLTLLGVLYVMAMSTGCHFHLHTYEVHKHGAAVQPDVPLTIVEIHNEVPE